MSESSAQDRPVIRTFITPRSRSDREKLQDALHKIAQEDSTVRIKTETLDGHSSISGMSELHLAGICERISHKFEVKIEATPPAVIYLETIRANSEAEGKYIRQTVLSGNYGHCRIGISPNETGKGCEFSDDTREGTIPKKYIRPIDEGIQNAMQAGILAGHEMVDIKVSLLDGSFHDVDSNEMAFKIAGSMAFKAAARKAKPILLEPIMAIEVSSSEDHIGTIIGDLNARRGRIEAIEGRTGSQSIKASVPLSEFLGYATHLEAVTSGKSDLSVRFLRYEASPLRDEWGGDDPAIISLTPSRPAGPTGSATIRLDEEMF